MMEEKAEQKLPEFTIESNHEAKLKELIRNLASTEVKLCADASKEFIKILNSDLGSSFIRLYVQASTSLVEISQAWELHKGKPGFSYILDLVSAILKHCKDSVGDDGVVNICRSLDKFARSVVEEKMGDLYKELNSKEGKRQNAALLLLASIVRCNAHLAWEMAKVFDFKLPIFPKLAEVRLRVKGVGNMKKKSYSTRKAFVAFAMAFLEVGNPRLLRGVLQQKEMYSGVLRGLGNDDQETVVYVLTVLRDRVLIPDSLVPPGLRSVLFGSVTLEQLASISAREDFVDAADLAHNVLVMVCTNPVNGLMPDMDRHPSPLRGNPKRLLDLMKKLKATEVKYHKVLLRAVVKGNPSFGSAYLDEFPYNLEDLASSTWFHAISLAADVVSSVSDGLSFKFGDAPPEFDSPSVQNILKCIGARPFTRLVVNKGLLHSDVLVKHGTLRLVLEALKLLNSLLNAVDHASRLSEQTMNSWASLKAEIRNGVPMLLPDPQVLLALLSPLNSHFKSLEYTTKRKAGMGNASEPYGSASKRRRTSGNEEIDIVVGGINYMSEVGLSGNGVADAVDEQQLKNGDDIVKEIGALWGLSQYLMAEKDIKDGDTIFYSKLLDTLSIYYRTVPMALEGLFDLFKLIPSNPLSIPTILLKSLLNLLNEHVSQFSEDVTVVRTQPQVYKHLHPFVVLLLYSRIKEIKEQAYVLAKVAIRSTGAFDNNPGNISAWFLFIPGYSGQCVHFEEMEVEVFQKLSSVVVSFLCDAVTTTGNNLYKYMDLLRQYSYDSDLSPIVSPFIICVLEKCLRLLSSESGSFTLPQKSLISLYVCNTIKYLLDTQVNPEKLSFLIDRVLSEKLENSRSKVDVSGLVECPCEWRPLNALLHFARDLLHRQCYSICSNVTEVAGSSNSFINILGDIKKALRSEYGNRHVGLMMGFSCSLMCARHTDLLQNFPSILCISNNLCGVPFSILASIFFLESSYLTDVSIIWPKMFSAGLENIIHVKEKKEEMLDRVDLDSMEATSVAFVNYLKKAPFCVLFSSIAQSSSLDLLEQSALQELLLDKLIKMPSDHLVSSLCNVLFWMNHARSSHKFRSSNELEKISKLCSVLAEHLLRQLLVENVDVVSPDRVKASPRLHCAVEVAEIILNHPAVTASLNDPLSVDEVFKDSMFNRTPEKLHKFIKRGVHPMDQHVLKLLKTMSELLFPMCSGQNYKETSNGCEHISRVYKALVQNIFLIFKNKFDGCILSNDFEPLVPTLYAIHNLTRFISAIDLLELVNWLFSQLDYGNTSFDIKSKETAIIVGLHLASFSFDLLSEYIWQPDSVSYWFLDCTDDHELRSHALLFQRVFFQVSDFAYHLKTDIADMCLLKAVKVVKLHTVIQHSRLPSIMIFCRVMESSPLGIVSYCLDRINRTKAELLYLIVEMSPQHLSVFGSTFSEALNKSCLAKVNSMQEISAHSFSDEELLMLLPTVLLFLDSVTSKFGEQIFKPIESIIWVYGRILLDGLSGWKAFASGRIFEIELTETSPTSIAEIINLFSENLLGKAIIMVRDHLALHEDLMNIEKKLSLFNSVFPCDSAHNIFDDGTAETGLDSLMQSPKFVNRVVAKVNFCRMLLLLDHSPFQSQQGGDGHVKLLSVEVNSDMEKSRIRFFKLLIDSWKLVVKKFPENAHYSGQANGQNLSLLRFLEIFLMSHILDMTTKMQDSLIKLSSLPFIIKLVKSSLLYRFGDHATLKMLQTVISSLSHGNFSCASAIQLLLGHSQFVKSIHMASKTLGTTQFGLSLTPMQSILRSLLIPHADLHTADCNTNTLASQNLILLELVKLLQILFHIYNKQKVNFGENTGVDSRELVFLLLSSYGATCSEVDMEIYDLIQEIESEDKSSNGVLAETDYLWGVASVKVRKDSDHNNDMQSINQKNIEVSEDHRKIQFRENLPVDPKLCAQTVLYFPYHRFVTGGSSHKLQKDGSMIVQKAIGRSGDRMQVYDPVFILRFSIHCLAMSYIEPIEFASLGLLAITFVSISSPDDDMRKLGYEVLAKLKSMLEKCQKKKDVRRLLLLLSHLQNGIEEPWQRIPSVITLFLAEASLVLLEPSHDNYSAISKYLMNSPSVNLKAIPLLQQFFWSSSVNFRAERSWMLRLLYAGINTEDDAQIYIKTSVFDILISFYTSPLSDNDSRELILQIVKKAVRLHNAVWFLVERCGVILWFSSIVSSLCVSECQEKKKYIFTCLPVILEVVSDITSHSKVLEWLQKHALEQLSELSSHLYKLLIGSAAIIKEQPIICNSILQILTLVLKMSQERKLYQPHFTLSAEGLYQLYEVIEVCSNTGSNVTMELGLKSVLMSTPVTLLQMDQEKLTKFLTWAVRTAIQSTLTNSLQPEDSDYNLISISGSKPPEEQLVSKLLRWLTASVILGKISRTLSKVESGSILEIQRLPSLQSLLEIHKNVFLESAGYGREHILAVSILYLLQMLGYSHGLLPSVVSALSLLLLSGSSSGFSEELWSSLPSFCSKIHCPAEANPAWRWSFYQPSGDLSLELSNLEKLEEIHACEKLLVVISKILVKQCLGSQDFPLIDVDNLHVYDRERSMIQSE